MIHTMRLWDAPFNMIKSGLKTIELRLYDEKRREVQIGDTIRFICANDQHRSLEAKVIALHRFDNFSQLYEQLPLEKCGYLPEEIPNASSADMEVYYSLSEQQNYGVVGIEISLLE